MQLNDGLSSKYDVIISNVEMSNNAPDAVAGSHLLMQTVLHYAKLLGGWKTRPAGSDASVILHGSSSAVAEGITAQYCANNQLNMTRLGVRMLSSASQPMHTTRRSVMLCCGRIGFGDLAKYLDTKM
jgi:hypothetical protein